MTATFGKLQGRSLELGDGLNIIEAPNETGKSTWCAFLLSILYGVNSRERDRAGFIADKNRFAPWSGAAMSGRMDCGTELGELTLTRATRRQTSPMGEFSAVYAGTNEPVPGLTGAACGETLLGISREVFERSAFIRQNNLPISQDAELERRIAALISSGEEGTSYTEAADALKKQLNRRRHNRTGQLPALETELAELDRQLSESNSLARQLVQARSEVEALSRRAEILQAELTDCNRWEAAQRRQALSGAASAAEQAEVRAAQVQANADSIITELKAGRDCAFATLGDAMTYSTFGYVLEIIREAIPGVELEIVPGITSFATLTAKAGTVLVENGEQLRVIPSFKSEMAETLDFPNGSTTILLKTYRSRKALVERLRREENVEILYGEHLAMEGQTLLTDLDAVADRPEEYLSLIMVKKQ